MSHRALLKRCWVLGYWKVLEFPNHFPFKLNKFILINTAQDKGKRMTPELDKHTYRGRRT